MSKGVVVAVLLLIGRVEAVDTSPEKSKEETQYLEGNWQAEKGKPVVRFIDLIIYTSSENVYDRYKTKKFDSISFPQEIDAQIVENTISNLEINSDFKATLDQEEYSKGGSEIISSVKYENLHGIHFEKQSITEILELLNKKSHSNFVVLLIQSKKIDDYIKEIKTLLDYFQDRDASKSVVRKTKGTKDIGTSFLLNPDDEKFKELLKAEIAARFVMLERVPRHQPFPEIDVTPILDAQKLISNYYKDLKESETEFNYLLFSLDILNKEGLEKFQSQRKELLKKLAGWCEAAGETKKAHLFLSDDPKFTGLGYYGIKNFRGGDQAPPRASESKSATNPQ